MQIVESSPINSRKLYAKQ